MIYRQPLSTIAGGKSRKWFRYLLSVESVRACYSPPMAPVIWCPLCQSPDVRVATIDERIAICRCNRCPAQFTVQRFDELPLTESNTLGPSSLKG